MIDYNDDELTMIITCDKCAAIEDFDGTWQETVQKAKERGWVIAKAVLSYEHYCPQCKSWE